jgi:siroheme synthase (precorrin-2 oxidase/ferrochelatase)
MMIYFWWDIWKERNRRTFQNKILHAREVTFLCKEEMDQFERATRPIVEGS